MTTSMSGLHPNSDLCGHSDLEEELAVSELHLQNKVDKDPAVLSFDRNYVSMLDQFEALRHPRKDTKEDSKTASESGQNGRLIARSKEGYPERKTWQSIFDFHSFLSTHCLFR